MASKEIAVFGCGGHGISVLDIILQHDPEASLVFVDEMAKPDETITTRSPQREFKVVTEIEPTTDREYFVAIGNDLKRREVSRSLGDVTLTKIVAKNAQLGMDSEVGDGAFIGHQAIIGPMARVGKGVIINTRSHISHEVEVGDYSQLTLDVTVGGRTKIGDNVFIGMRSCIFDRLTICSDTIIGANSLVNKDIDEPGTYIGIPARRVS